MLVRRMACWCAATALVGFANTSFAENSVPSSATLSSMGLSGIQVMTDSQSMAVRGKGYSGYGGHHYDVPTSSAIAYGRSYAKVAAYGGKAGSYDGFYSEHPYTAYGAHGSIAGVYVSYPKGHGGGPGPKVYGGNGGPQPPHKPPHHQPQPKKIVAFSGGFSFAH